MLMAWTGIVAIYMEKSRQNFLIFRSLCYHDLVTHLVSAGKEKGGEEMTPQFLI